MTVLNRIVLIGRLTATPALRHTQSGKAVCRYTLAIDRRPRGNGEKETDFVDCVEWDRAGEATANHMDRGCMVAVEGRLQIRNYEAQDGQKRKAAEVVVEQHEFLTWPNDRQQGGTTAQPGAAAKNPDDLADLDDDPDIPF